MVSVVNVGKEQLKEERLMTKQRTKRKFVEWKVEPTYMQRVMDTGCKPVEIEWDKVLNTEYHNLKLDLIKVRDNIVKQTWNKSLTEKEKDILSKIKRLEENKLVKGDDTNGI